MDVDPRAAGGHPAADDRGPTAALGAALAVLRCPALGRPARLAAVGLATGALIETLQWMLPLGRVVSPVDALLNAAGAVIAGLLATRLRPRRVPARPGTAARAVGTTA